MMETIKLKDSSIEKSQIELIVEKEKLKFERKLQNVVQDLEDKRRLEIDQLKEDTAHSILKMRDRVKKLELVRQENLSVILQKEGNIRLLQEKIRAEENNKDTQLQHAQVLSEVWLFTFLDFC